MSNVEELMVEDVVRFDRDGPVSVNRPDPLKLTTHGPFLKLVMGVHPVAKCSIGVLVLEISNNPGLIPCGLQH